MATNLLVSQQIAFLLKSSYKHFERLVERKKRQKPLKPYLRTCWSPFFSPVTKTSDIRRVVATVGV